MRFATIIILAGLLVSCGQQNGQINARWLPHGAANTVIILQPLAYGAKFLPLLKDSIPNYYPVTLRIAPPLAMPTNAWYAPRGRYKADSILAFLLTVKPGFARIIVGITDKDISAKKGNINDYGIMGLGNQPGYTCVVSTYRLQKDHPTEQLLFQRLLKTAIHEIGHNFGLPHCPNRHCIMADAEGGLNQDNETGLCEVCRKKLGLK